MPYVFSVTQFRKIHFFLPTLVISDNQNITELQMQVFIRLESISKYTASSNECKFENASKERIQTHMI